MISMIRFGLILIFSLFIASCSDYSSHEQARYGDIMGDVSIIQYSDSMREYSIDADSLISVNDSLHLRDVKYIRKSIVLDADSMLQYAKTMIFSGNVHIMLEDSMEIETGYIRVHYDSDFVYTDDSVFINKADTRMITRGFTTDTDFSEIIFSSRVIMYGKN